MQKIRLVHSQAALAIFMAPAATLVLGCSSDHFLGDMSGPDLTGGGAESGTAGGQDFLMSPALAAPTVSMAEETDFFGSLAASIGDFDGDGFGDFATRNSEGSVLGSEYVQIRYGGPRPADDQAAWIWTENGGRLLLDLGGLFPESSVRSIVAVGDVDADGYSDFIVGLGICRQEEAGALLFYGGPTRLEGGARVSERGVYLRDPHINGGGGCGGGMGVAGLGDFDGDGFDDFMLSHPIDVDLDVTANEPGGAYLFYGGTERLATGTSWLDADVRIAAPQSLALAPTGDMNGDGLGDVIIGSPGVQYSDPRWAFRAEPRGFYWLPGRTERLSGDLDLREAHASTGLADATPLGDLDGDGLNDIFLYDDDGVTPHLIYGAAGVFDSGIELSLATATLSPNPGALYTTLIPASDLDGDGDAELVSSQSFEEGPHLPQLISLLSGSSRRLSGAVELAAPSTPYADPARALEQVFPIGDLDGDGAAELATRSGVYPGAPEDYADGYSETDGILHIHYGTPGGGLANLPR